MTPEEIRDLAVKQAATDYFTAIKPHEDKLYKTHEDASAAHLNDQAAYWAVMEPVYDSFRAAEAGARTALDKTVAEAHAAYKSAVNPGG